MISGSVQLRTPLQAALHDAPIAESMGADFKKFTWTFKVGPRHALAAGRYVIIPEVIARLALENEASQVGGPGIHLLPLQGLRAAFGQYRGYTEIDAFDPVDDRHVYCLRREHVPPEKYPEQWHPARWNGYLRYRSVDGRVFDSSFTDFVTDDFGDLVEVRQ